jgi:ferric-dicitrate binding protein FerR (iron transport regulator)
MQYDYDALIAKHFSLENDPDEEAALQEWLQNSEANKRYFAQMQRVWAMADVALPPLNRPIDTEAALLRVKSHATGQLPARTAQRKTLRWWPYVAAASFVGLLIAGVLVWRSAPATAVEQIASGSSILRDTLSDGSHVVLNRNSALTTRFSATSRRAVLKGEALFEVNNDDKKPFFVEIQSLEIKAIGTKFYVDNNEDADVVTISVQEGRVEISDRRHTERLGAGQKSVYRLSTRAFVTQESGSVSDPNETAWSDRRLIFDNLPLSQVIPVLEKTYQVSIVLKNKELGNCRLYSRYQDEPLERILDIIAETFSATIVVKNGVYELSGGQCE